MIREFGPVDPAAAGEGMTGRHGHAHGVFGNLFKHQPPQLLPGRTHPQRHVQAPIAKAG
ncbi:MAG: hypothetical protein JWL59_5012 [Chthoniobacteraceae bacterium]|nr:hypothetical protein [Chthoniobacteraceae bacterium]